jgi:hypothetical protein
LADENKSTLGSSSDSSSIVDRVLVSFIDALRKDTNTADVATRLQDLLLEKREKSEAGLRAALFEDGAL